jgi:hypothetical protein
MHCVFINICETEFATVLWWLDMEPRKVPINEYRQWLSPSWAGVGHGPPGKIKKSTIIGLFYEIL